MRPLHVQVWFGKKTSSVALFSGFSAYFSCPLANCVHPGKLIFCRATLGHCTSDCACFPGCFGIRRTSTAVQLIKPEHCSVRKAEKGQCPGAYQPCVFTSVFGQRCVCLLACLSGQVCPAMSCSWTGICQELWLVWAESRGVMVLQRRQGDLKVSKAALFSLTAANAITNYNYPNSLSHINTI